MIVLHLDMCRQTLSEVNLTVLVAESVGGKCQRLAGDGMAEGDVEGVEIETACFLFLRCGSQTVCGLV